MGVSGGDYLLRTLLTSDPSEYDLYNCNINEKDNRLDTGSAKITERRLLILRGEIGLDSSKNRFFCINC